MWPFSSCNFSFTLLFFLTIDLYLKSEEKVSRTVGVQKQLRVLLADLEERLNRLPFPVPLVCTSACRDGIHCLYRDLLLYGWQVARLPLQSKSKLTRA